MRNIEYMLNRNEAIWFDEKIGGFVNVQEWVH